MAAESMCSWCGARVGEGEAFRAYEPAGERTAAFCRLEHVVPWAIKGPHWSAGPPPDPGELDSAPERCARCDAELGEVRVVLVRHRGPHRIPDAFCSVDHLREWAAAGGRWQ